jgi:type II secretory ATPase GspE/PulE/Tfp pilus assembly ATPase PilB-like protein
MELDPGSAASLALRERLSVTVPVASALSAALQGDRGLLLVAGPTSMGKTTLAVELLGVRKAEARATTFHGDLRDAPSTRAAVRDARTRFVVAVLRSGGSRRVLPRLRDTIGPLPPIPTTIVTMRLLPRLCGACRRAASFRHGPPLATYWRGEGCDECEGGYAGKVRVVEVLRYDAEASSEGRPPRESSGDLATDGRRRLVEGLVTADDLAFFVPRPEGDDAPIDA